MAEYETPRQVFLLKIADLYQKKEKDTQARASRRASTRQKHPATREQLEQKADVLLDKENKPGREYEAYLHLCQKYSYTAKVDHEKLLSAADIDEIKRRMKSMDIFRPDEAAQAKDIKAKTKIFVFSNSKKDWCEGVVKSVLPNDQLKVQYKTGKASSGKHKYSDKNVHRAAMGTAWKLRDPPATNFSVISDEELMQAFDDADVDGNGTISAKEFRQLLKNLHCDLASIGLNDKVVFNTIDTDRSGSIDFDEFRAAAGTKIIETLCSKYSKKKGIHEWTPKEVYRWIGSLKTKNFRGKEYEDRFRELQVDGEGLLDLKTNSTKLKSMIDKPLERGDFKSALRLLEVWYKYLIALTKIDAMPTLDEETLARMDTEAQMAGKMDTRYQTNLDGGGMGTLDMTLDEAEAKLEQDDRPIQSSPLERQVTKIGGGEQAQAQIANLRMQLAQSKEALDEARRAKGRSAPGGDRSDEARDAHVALMELIMEQGKGQYDELGPDSSFEEMTTAVNDMFFHRTRALGNALKTARAGKTQLVDLIERLADSGSRDRIKTELGVDPTFDDIAQTLKSMFKEGQKRVLHLMQQNKEVELKNTALEQQLEEGGETPVTNRNDGNSDMAHKLKSMSATNKKRAQQIAQYEEDIKDLEQDKRDLEAKGAGGCCVIS